MTLPANASKKEIRIELSKTLATTLNGLKDNIPVKKLDRNIKKASKILLSGLKLTSKKKKSSKKKKETPVT